MFERIKVFIQESRQELKRVNWPTRSETAHFTVFVIGLSLAVALVLGIFDYAFLQVLQNLVL